MDTIEICIATYQRYYRLPEIVKQLLTQNDQDFRLNIWNNSGKDLTPFLKEFPQDRLQVINSETNEGSAARFKLVPKTTGKYILFFDDDETILPEAIGYMRKVMEVNGDGIIAGWYTRTFVGKGYGDSFNDVEPGTEVDYVGTGGMILNREIFDKEPTLQDIPKPYDKVEDLYLCYIARMKYNMHPIKCLPLFVIINDGKDQFQGIDKEDIFLRLRASGYVLVKDMILKQHAFQNLIDFRDTMKELNIPWWLSEGLLLGLYRNKDCIIGDEDDSDICLWNEYADRSDEIISALKKKGFEVINDWKFEDGKSEGIAVYRFGNKIDIIFTRKGKDKVFFLARNFGNMGTMPYFIFAFPKDIYNEFDEIEWSGQKFPCMKDVEGYLTARYGDWKTQKLRGIDYNPDSTEDNPCYLTNTDYKTL